MDSIYLKYLFEIVVFISGVVFSYFKLRKNACNPFIVKEAFPSRPIEMDRKKRKLILKRYFRQDRVPDKLDAIVIGSGIGGLTCAGLLSRSGKRVLVLEQHDRAGGCTHSYKSKGFEFDVGIHYVGNMIKGSMDRHLIDLITDSQLEWDKIDEQFDTVVFNRTGFPAKTYSFSKGIKEFQKQIIADFPSEKKAIDQFFYLLNSCKFASTIFCLIKILPHFLLKVFASLQLHKVFFYKYEYVTKYTLCDILNSLTDNNELKSVLSYPFGDYGTPPDQSCFLMHAMLINHLYRQGGYYPKGGASEIAYQMIPGIVRNGGAVLTQAFVKEIIIKNGSACGVSLSMPNGNYCTIKAPIIISSAGIYNTFTKMLPPHIVDKYQVMKDLYFAQPGISCMQIMVGLDGTSEDLLLPMKNFWLFTSHNVFEEFHKYIALTREDAASSPIPLLFVSFPSAKDSTWNIRHPNKSTCIIITLSSLNWFEDWKEDKTKKRGLVYDNLKKSFADQALLQVLQQFPQLKGKISYIECGTPLSHIHYLNSVHGEIYGIDHNKERFYFENAMNLRPSTSIPGLYLTGQDIFSCGFMGGAFSGLLTASKVLNRYLLLDLVTSIRNDRKIKKNN